MEFLNRISVNLSDPGNHVTYWCILNLGEGELPTATSKRPYARKRKADDEDAEGDDEEEDQ